MIHDIFKIPVYEVDLDLDTEKLYVLCNQHKTNSPSRIRTNVGGYQSDNLDLTFAKVDSVLGPLLKEIQIHSSNFAKEFVDNHQQSLSNIWMNINSFGDYNRCHNHPDSTISGVYYVKTPRCCGNIVFEHPAISVFNYYFKDAISREKYNEYNAQAWWKPAVENRLYLFPSWLLHKVQPNLNPKKERISISFNLM